MNAVAALALGAAILAEVVATAALKASDGFTRIWPSLVTVLGYVIAFYCLSLTLRSVPVGIVYGIWSGVGIVLISSVGYLFFGEKLDGPALGGLALIVVGVLVVNIFSSSVRQ